ncbi:MAG TPA: amidohydrolase family protein, partial [Thermoplasmata archaeon]|nr:amidohydrolase family protein [Thermoplasmata archaeon]
PGHEEKEDFFSGTRAAARGGVTCVLDMPNTEPPTKYIEDVEDKIRRARAKAVVDFGVYALLSSPTLAGRVAPHVAGFKVYLAASTGELQSEKSAFEDALTSPHIRGKVVAVHAEDPARFSERPVTDLAAWNEARPEAAEVSAVEYVCGLSKGLAARKGAPRLHLAHLTTPKSLELARAAGVSHEVALRHLLLSERSPEARALGPKAKVNPPLRSEATRKKMLDELRGGRIPILATDHAPHLDDDKLDFESAASGMPEIEWALPVMFAMAKRGDLPLERVLDASTSVPAELFGMKKGSIEVGRQADLAVFSPADLKKVGKLQPLTKCGWSPYSAFEAVFPRHVFLRGTQIVDDHEVVGDRGGGRNIVKVARPAAKRGGE